MDCSVCCETLRKSKTVNCGSCEYTACTSCVQRFILDTPTNVHCMSCKIPWDREVLESKFTKTFLNGPLKAHRQEILFEVEKGLMPDTQPAAEIAKVIMAMEDKRKEMNLELKNIKFALQEIQFVNDLETLTARKNLKTRMLTLKQELIFITEAKRMMSRPGVTHAGQEEARRTFIKPCPSADCRGFLSTAWKCGLCDIKVCSKCHDIKQDNITQDNDDNNVHVCSPENIATVEALAKDSKPCPKCGTVIQRIEGCSQMFHTPLWGGCGAVFDWNTLRLQSETTGIHNPHWYEYQRIINGGNVPRQAGDIPCGGIPRLQDLERSVTSVAGKSSPVTNKVYAMHRGYTHNQYVVLPAYRVNIVDDNRDLRIKYLVNTITETHFKKMIQQRDKARDKKAHIGGILQMYQAAIGDILMRIGGAQRDPQFNGLETITNILAESDALINYTNECLSKAATLYSCVKLYINKINYCVLTEKKPATKK